MSEFTNSAHAANVAAKLHAIPAEPSVDRPLPAIEVAGILVFAYVDERGEFIVSVHAEDADSKTFPHWSESVPMRVHGVGDFVPACPCCVDNECGCAYTGDTWTNRGR